MADIEITHTRADGTLLDGSTKGDGVLELVRPYGFKWFRSLGILGMPRSRDKAAWKHRINGAADALRAAGHTVTVTINEDTRRTFADAEQDRYDRAADRADRFDERAGKAKRASDAAWERTRQMGEVMQGEPIKVGHHSEGRHRRDLARVDALCQRSIADGKKAEHLADRAEASARYEAHRKNPGVTLRRLDKLRADLRRIEKWQRGESAGGFKEAIGNPDTVAELARRHGEVTEQIEHWEGVIADAEARGFKVWGQADFTKGDFARYNGRWFQVLRVNAKSVTIPHIHNGIGRDVVRAEDAHLDWTWTAPYDGVTARRSAEEMAAILNPAPAEEGQEAAGAELADEQQAAAVETAPEQSAGDRGETAEAFAEAASGVAAERVAEEVSEASDLGGQLENLPKNLIQIGLVKSGPESMYVTTETTTNQEETTMTATATAPAKTPRKPRKAATPAKAPVKKTATPAPAAERKTSLRTIPTDKIDRDPTQPREHFDQAKLEELAASLKTLGQLQPVSVRPATQFWVLPCNHGVLNSCTHISSVRLNAPSPTPQGSSTEKEASASKAVATKSTSHSASSMTEKTSAGGFSTPGDSAQSSDSTRAGKTSNGHGTSLKPEPLNTSSAPACPICESSDATPSKPSPKSGSTSRMDAGSPGRQEKTDGFSTTRSKQTGSSRKRSGVLSGLSVTDATNSGITLIDAHGRGLTVRSDSWILIMGERRWRAAQLAQLATMQAVVEHGIADGDRETLAKAIAENVGREDMTPIEEAKAFQRLIDAGYTVEDIVKLVGKSWNFVDIRLALLKLTPAMQEALVKGHIPVGLAWYVSNLNTDNQNAFLGRWARGAFKSVRDAETFAQACRAEEQRTASQGSMFVLAQETETADATGDQGPLFQDLHLPVDEREQIVSDRQQLVKKIGRLSLAGEILTEIAAMDPGELALLLSGAHGGIPGNRLRVDHLKDLAGKASTNIRQAQAIASVRAGALLVAPDAEAGAA